MTRKHHPHLCVTSLKLLADYWTLAIINALRTGEMRYCDLQRATFDVNPVTLGNRLRKLQQAGLIVRRTSEENNAVSYQLTSLGEAALPILAAIEGFSKELDKQS